MSQTLPLDETEVDRVQALYPATRIGSEQEYKWLIERVPLMTDRDRALDFAVALPRPGDELLDQPFTHTQTSVYFDHDWRLTDADITMKVLANYGAYRNVSWVCAKQTVAWIDGCRDSLEISQRFSVGEVSDVMARRAAVPLQYVGRLVPEATQLTPYATATQVRHKVPMRAADGAIFQLSLDVATTKTLHDGRTITDTWIEIETSNSELPARRWLNEWAGTLTKHLGVAPHRTAKPQRAARQAGWRGSDAG